MQFSTHHRMCLFQTPGAIYIKRSFRNVISSAPGTLTNSGYSSSLNYSDDNYNDCNHQKYMDESTQSK
jgi:hypothetical protein